MPLLKTNKQKEKCYEESKIKKTIEIKTKEEKHVEMKANCK